MISASSKIKSNITQDKHFKILKKFNLRYISSPIKISVNYKKDKLIEILSKNYKDNM